MHNREFRHIGRRTGRIVRDAIRSGNFEDIGEAVENGVQELTDDMNGVWDSLKSAGRYPSSHHARNRPQDGAFRNDADGCTPSPVYRNPAEDSTFRCRMPGNISGLVYTIIGFLAGIPLLIVDIAILAVGVTGSMPVGDFVAAVSVLSSLAAAAFCMTGRGIVLRRRARRFVRYRDAMGGAAFCTVAKLADSVGGTQDRTKKDLRKMIDCGACPQGHLDRGATCFMVDDETYEAYLEAEKAYAARRQAAAQAEQQKKQEDPKEAELAAVEKEGVEYLQQIRAVNDALPGKEISDKLDRLENVTGRIFACVGQHPEKLPDIRSFMRYYLPTTLKLVKSYEEFESQPVQGENITKAKAEIMQALDTINTAFGNLLDSLFADDALDVSSDISTLETMLKQGGLTGSDFSKTPDSGKLS